MPKPSKEAVSDVPTPWAIICEDRGLAGYGCGCGRVYLTEAEYERQMAHPDSRWQCPKCGKMPVDWDDDNYDTMILGGGTVQ